MAGSQAGRRAGGNRKRPPGFPPSLPLAIDREELAWAAGFFDGEGSTLSVDRVRMYPWISINQGGTLDGPPDVLVRFRRVAGGIGHIDGPRVFRDHPDWLPLWNYRVAGFELVQAVIAVLWHHLGPVKRAQARDVLQRWLAKPQGRRGDGVRYGRSYNDRCKRGHDYSDVYVAPSGFRSCRPCRRITLAARRVRLRGKRSGEGADGGNTALREAPGSYRYFRSSRRSGTVKPSAAICGSTSAMYC